MSKPYIYSFTEPINPEALHMLLRQTDWANMRSPLDIQRMLDRSQITLGVWDDDKLIAFSRVITDDMFRALIDDVVVDAAVRSQGIAATMLDKLLKRLQHVEQVMLDCDTGLSGFYARFGFRDKGCCSMLLEKQR